ncbi:hypothetical protein EC9_19800 [Rosistilla ulvae]|uniref:Uncharacterized protein n=1 Tax=Rosistilla ulvae TaxID=1930277 RepID=A0A517LYU0_9BACT|nr:hypothetical protein [Rosistilla ulvae]QDS87797.1 hypothetical protein EC9_19800 [Rosistilla ulvae]
MTAKIHTFCQIVIPVTLMAFMSNLQGEETSSGQVVAAPAMSLSSTAFTPSNDNAKSTVRATVNEVPELTIPRFASVANQSEETKVVHEKTHSETRVAAQAFPKKLVAEQEKPTLRSIRDISLNIATVGAPKNRYQTDGEPASHLESYPTSKSFCWVAPGTVHNPLYFEDVALERYGKGCYPCIQPAVSGVRFFSDALLLPYQMGLDCPCELEYTLGYQRPGNCAPSVEKQLPWSWKGALMEAGFVGGGLFMFPL